MNIVTIAEVRRLFVADLDSVQARFLALADAIPEEEYCWRPAPGVRSIGETFLRTSPAGTTCTRRWRMASQRRRLFRGSRAQWRRSR